MQGYNDDGRFDDGQFDNKFLMMADSMIYQFQRCCFDDESVLTIDQFDDGQFYDGQFDHHFIDN